MDKNNEMSKSKHREDSANSFQFDFNASEWLFNNQHGKYDKNILKKVGQSYPRNSSFRENHANLFLNHTTINLLMQ